MFAASYTNSQDVETCIVPKVMRGLWFSYEKHLPMQTEFHIDSMSDHGRCVSVKREHLVNYTFVFQNEKRNRCFHCVKILVRTPNVLEKMERKFTFDTRNLHMYCEINLFSLNSFFFVLVECETLNQHEVPTVERVCQNLKEDQQLVTLFAENFVPVNCRSSLEGVWQFAYQVNFVHT
jgi:hypothetical protein